MADEPSMAESKVIYEKWHDAALAQERQWYGHLISESNAWGMETLRHLALISLAGLAGVFVLIGANHDIGGVPAYLPAMLFSVSCALCILSMHCAQRDRDVCIDHQGKLIEKLVRHEQATDADCTKPKRAEFWGSASIALGWTSAILVVAGGVILFLGLT